MFLYILNEIVLLTSTNLTSSVLVVILWLVIFVLECKSLAWNISNSLWMPTFLTAAYKIEGLINIWIYIFKLLIRFSDDIFQPIFFAQSLFPSYERKKVDTQKLICQHAKASHCDIIIHIFQNHLNNWPQN